MIRSFLAIAAPDEVGDAALDLQDGLRGANWTPTENLHLTLAFLGQQPRGVLEDLDAHLLGLRVAPFEVRLAGVGHFGVDARAVFLAAEACPALVALQAKVATAARDAGVELPRRKFAPHVTIGRWRRGEVRSEELRRYVETRNPLRLAPFQVDALHLYRSDLHRDGPRYDVMATYALTG